MKSIMTRVIMGVMVFGTSMAVAGELVPVGLQKQLFVDDYVVEETKNVVYELGQAKKIGVVLEPSLPTDYHPGVRGEYDPNVQTESLKEDISTGHRGSSKRRKPDGSAISVDMGWYTTALWNEHEEKFQMWYMAWRLAGTGYAESKDGIHWTKPLVGVGVTDEDKGNIIIRGQSFSCIIDPTVPWGHPEKFKGALDSNLDNKCMASLAHSPDGIHWTWYNDGKPVTYRAGDGYNHIYWDPIKKEYRLMSRTDLGAEGGEKEIRTVRIMRHKTDDIMNDPENWETMIDEISVDDPKGEINKFGIPRLQMHGMTSWVYEGIYFATLDVYTMDRGRGFEGWDYYTRHDEDYFEYYIGTSRDGINFDKSWIYKRKPLVWRGPAGSFDKGGIRPPSQIITHNDEHWIYYSGVNERHYARGRDCKIALAKLRLDGFVCLEAKDEWGQVTTKPFKLEGCYLPDTGLEFGDRGNGFSYGWDQDVSDGTRQRSSGPDQRYNSIAQFADGTPAIWEIGLPNGTYDLFYLCGDPGNDDSLHDLDVEGVVVLDPDGEDEYDEFNVTVTVSDGRLTIKQAESGYNGKFAFIEISRDGQEVVKINFQKEPGEVPEGDTLEVNIDASDGEFLVEVLDENDEPYHEYGWDLNRIWKGVDDLRFKPRWKGDKNLEPLKGKVVKLRFHLRNAKLYAFQIK